MGAAPDTSPARALRLVSFCNCSPSVGSKSLTSPILALVDAELAGNSAASAFICATHEKDLYVLKHGADSVTVQNETKLPRRGHAMAVLHLPSVGAGASTSALSAATTPVIVAGDKIGDVHAFPVPDVASKRKHLLGHTASIVTGVAGAVVGGKRSLLTCDRDEKVRVSAWPDAFNVRSYCCGHTRFVSSMKVLSSGVNASSAAPVGASAASATTCSRSSASAAYSYSPQELLVTGGGDGTLRLWHHETGTLLHTLYLSKLDSSASSASESASSSSSPSDGAARGSRPSTDPHEDESMTESTADATGGGGDGDAGSGAGGGRGNKRARKQQQQQGKQTPTGAASSSAAAAGGASDDHNTADNAEDAAAGGGGDGDADADMDAKIAAARAEVEAAAATGADASAASSSNAAAPAHMIPSGLDIKCQPLGPAVIPLCIQEVTVAGAAGAEGATAVHVAIFLEGEPAVRIISVSLSKSAQAISVHPLQALTWSGPSSLPQARLNQVGYISLSAPPLALLAVSGGSTLLVGTTAAAPGAQTGRIYTIEPYALSLADGSVAATHLQSSESALAWLAALNGHLASTEVSAPLAAVTDPATIKASHMSGHLSEYDKMGAAGTKNDREGEGPWRR